MGGVSVSGWYAKHGIRLIHSTARTIEGNDGQ